MGLPAGKDDHQEATTGDIERHGARQRRHYVRIRLPPLGHVRTQSGTFQTIPTKHTFAVILKLVGQSV
jgi:hypothetical protein